MGNKLIWIAVKEALKKAWDYVKVRLWGKIKEACLEAWNSVKETLWNKIKNEVKACALEIVLDTEVFLKSAEMQEKEKLILDTLMAKIELPIVLRPFKIIIRKILKDKIEETIQGLLNKGKEFIG